MVETLTSVPLWADHKFTKAEWDSYFAACRQFRAAPADVRAKAIAESATILRDRPFNFKGEEEAKLFVFLRLYFEVDPRLADLATKGYMNSPKRNLQWPIAIAKDGTIYLSEIYAGSRGPQYDPLLEYQRFSKRFKARDLTKLHVKLEE